MLICAGRTFIAGADISEFGKPPKGASAARTAGRDGRRPEAGDRGDPRHGARRRLRDGAGLPLSRRGSVGEIRPARNQARPHSRRRRHAAPAASERRRRCARGHPVGHAVRRQAGARRGASSTRSSRRENCARARSLSPARSSTRSMPLRKMRDLNDKIDAARGKPEIFEEIRKANARKFRGFEAWESAIGAVQAAVDLPFDEGMKLERQAFVELIPSDAVAGPALRVLRRAQVVENRRRAGRHADAADQEGRRHRRRHDGRRHRDEFPQRRNSRDDRRNRRRTRSIAASA